MIAFLLSLLLLFPAPRDANAALTCQVRQHRQKRVCWCAPSQRGPRKGSPARRSVVVVDAQGLPVPVPPEWHTAALAAQQRNAASRGVDSDGH